MTSDESEVQRKAEIEARAHAIWEEEGRPFGKHLEHWLRAQRLVAAAAGEVVMNHPETAVHALKGEEEL
jgi:hypothetical protein